MICRCPCSFVFDKSKYPELCAFFESQGEAIESQKKEAEKAAFSFLERAQNFALLTKGDCLGRLSLANAQGDLDMSESEMHEVATDQAYAAAASYVSHNQMPMMARRNLGQKIDVFQRAMGGTTMTPHYGNMQQGLAIRRAHNTHTHVLANCLHLRISTCLKLTLPNNTAS